MKAGSRRNGWAIGHAANSIADAALASTWRSGLRQTFGERRLLVICGGPDKDGTLLAAWATEHDFSVRIMLSLAELMRCMLKSPAVLILNGDPDDASAESACRALRDRGFAAPIVCVGSDQSVPTEKEVLSWGADAFVGRPIDVEQLEARVFALMRRDSGVYLKRVEFAGFRLDTEANRVIVNDHAIRLTKTEFRILLYLARRPHQVVSVGELDSTCMPSPGAAGDSRKERVHIRNLRRKLGSAGRAIRNVTGCGYVFDPSLLECGSD